MIPTLTASYEYCEHLARHEAGNFYHAFRLLPRPQRRAMCALYAFMRVADDLSDGPEPVAEKRVTLAGWRRGLNAALSGQYEHALHPALHDTVRTYRIPPIYLEDVITGVCMDLEPVRYQTFADLYKYCYHVASVVGLSCIHVWGFHGEEAKHLAEAAGIAFQLTNILRDLAEDANRGRVYVPREDLDRFGYSTEQLFQGDRDEPFRRLMEFEVERARGYYEKAQPLEQALRPAGRAVFRVMSRTYRGLLEEIVRRQYDVYSERVRVSRWRKLWFMMQALPVRWGWTP